jgi:MFS transporter, DHA1 family, multidrug resistance protein
VLLFAAWWMLPDTLAPQLRHTGGLSTTVHVFGRLVRNRVFMGYTLAMGASFGAMASYISGSPFVLEDIHGVSPQLFSVLFALNAAGIIAASQLSRSLVGRYGPARLLALGVTTCAAGGLGVLASVVFDLGLGGLLPSFFVMVSSLGIVLPNSTALALADHPRTAGSASALLGVAQFACGAIAAPLAGVGGSNTALPLAIVSATLSVSAVAFLAVLTRGAPHRAVEVRAGQSSA